MTFLRSVRRRALAALLVCSLALLGGMPAAQAAPKPVKVTFKASQTKIAKGEMVWLKGKVRTTSGKAVKGAKVRLEQRTKNGKWRKVATVKSRSGGTFVLRQRPAKRYYYRARVLASSSAKKATGPERKIRFTATPRTLEVRADALGARLGTARGAQSTTKVSKSTTATYRDYSKMMLVEVAKPSKVRTWLVTGDIRKAYRKAGGPEGKLGVPLADPKCGLLQSGCVQRFKGGAIYDNKNTERATIVYGKGRRTEVLAAAKSQVGFAEKRNNTSPYNKWTKSLGEPWCAAFQSWASAAAGSKAIPKHGRLGKLMKDLRKNAPERFHKKPKVGALVFFDNDDDGVAEPTHVGLVLKVNRSSITTFEGNTTNPATGTGRGVYQKTRTLSHPIYYWYPEY